MMSLRMEKEQLRQEEEECRERLGEETQRLEAVRTELASLRENGLEISKELCALKIGIKRWRLRNVLVICSVACVFMLVVVLFGKK